jgi:hypothetical protein
MSGGHIASNPAVVSQSGEWSSSTRSCLGYVFEVQVDSRGPREHVEALLSAYDITPDEDITPRQYAVRTTGPDEFALFVDGESLTADANAWHVLAMLQWHLNQAVVADGAARYVLLHAAAAVRDGVTVILAAPMEHGKTTTVAGLVRSGYHYLSDETVALVPDSLDVHAYPKPLTLDRGSWPLFPEMAVAPIGPADASWFVPASRFHPDAQVRSGGPPLLVLLPAFQSGAVTRSALVPPAQALVELSKSTFRFTEHPARNLRVLADLVQRHPTYALEIGDLDLAVAEIDRLRREVT